jgi:hypothetical protein
MGIGDYAEAITPCIVDYEELVFNYEYIYKFESKIAKALTVVKGDLYRTDLLKNRKIGLIVSSL